MRTKKLNIMGTTGNTIVVVAIVILVFSVIVAVNAYDPTQFFTVIGYAVACGVGIALIIYPIYCLKKCKDYLKIISEKMDRK
jgi:hypothetical protein